MSGKEHAVDYIYVRWWVERNML